MEKAKTFKCKFCSKENLLIKQKVINERDKEDYGFEWKCDNCYYRLYFYPSEKRIYSMAFYTTKEEYLKDQGGEGFSFYMKEKCCRAYFDEVSGGFSKIVDLDFCVNYSKIKSVQGIIDKCNLYLMMR